MVIIAPRAQAALVQIKNPYEGDLINYLYIVLKGVSTVNFGLSQADLEIRNTLHPFIQHGIFGCMGIFDGRKETLHKIKDSNNGVFVFVINGAFEVNGRLLEERDALALWETEEADIEALSENAIILLFEVPLNGFTA